jgi:predicted dehydrogenase
MQFFMSNKIRIGLIGGGEGSFIGSIHYRAAILDGYFELVCGAFSRDPEKSSRAGERYHVAHERAYPSWEKMFETEASLPADKKMEAIMITTPNNLHHPQVMMALDKGFHVICDKPVTISLSQAEDIEQKVKETGLIFMLTHTYTGYPMVREARHLVAKGTLGTLRKLVVEYPQGWLSTPLENSGSKQAEWRSDPKHNGPGGCLGDIGVHAHNLAEFITGLTIDELCADITSFVPGRKLDDDASVLLRFKGGAKGILYSSQISAGEENNIKIRIYGEKGGLEWQQQDPNTLLLKMLDQPAQVLRAGTKHAYLSEEARWNLRLPGGHPEGFLEAFANLYRNVAYDINSIKQGVKPEPAFINYPTIKDGVSGMRFIEKAIESAHSNQKWIKFLSE